MKMGDCMDEPEKKYRALIDRLRSYQRLAVAFSGGVDSAFLLAAAKKALGENQAAICAAAPMFPQSETDGAIAFCSGRQIRRIEFAAPSLELEAFCANPPERCYICKHALFTRMKQIAEENGFPVLADGTNADDCKDYRPGMKALAELGIVSPLLETGFTKAEIREMSRRLGLSGWNRPSAACLASRIPYGERITPEKLDMIEQAEQYLAALGCRQLRVRMHGDLARIEVLPEDLTLIAENRQRISEKFRTCGFSYVTLDLDGYRTGSMNEVLGR